MEPSSWPGHFRNRYILRRDWRSVPISGTIGVGRSRRFFCALYLCPSRSKFDAGGERASAACSVYLCAQGQALRQMLRPRQHHRLLRRLILRPLWQVRRRRITPPSTPLRRTRKRAPGARAARNAGNRLSTRPAPLRFRRRSSANITCKVNLQENGTQPRKPRCRNIKRTTDGNRRPRLIPGR